MRSSLLPAASNPRAAEQLCLSLLESCRSVVHLLQVQSFVLKSGLQSNTLILTKFTSVASSVAAPFSVPYSLIATAPPNHFDTFLLNTLIRAFPATAPSSFSLMLRLHLAPNLFTFPFLLKACASLRELRLATQVHSSSLRFGFSGDDYARNTLIHAYASCDGEGLDLARKVFDEMPNSTAVAWSAMIGGYVRRGFPKDAVDLFRRMQVTGVSPDDVTIITVLAACPDLGALDIAKWIASYVERENLPRTMELCNALVDTLAKCGDMDGAVSFFHRMPKKNIVSWTSVIGGLAMHGRGREAASYFESMTESGVAPDDVAFIGVLAACSHAGMVDEGCRFFDSMSRDWNMEPKMEHYGCMVDLFCRAGEVERAIRFVESMPIKPNPVILRTLTGACRVHGKLQLGERITRPLIDDHPMDASNYVMLSHIYASMERWERKSEIRNEMGNLGIWKLPGCTFLELEGKIYEFVSGDTSHPDVHGMLEEVGRELKRGGYVAAACEVLLDIEEEDKEDAVQRHSEKLALAFALLRTAPGTPVRMVKNLRVCRDCHNAMKIASRVYRREIVMRDRNRFHIFKDGFCNCGDFW